MKWTRSKIANIKKPKNWQEEMAMIIAMLSSYHAACNRMNYNLPSVLRLYKEYILEKAMGLGPPKAYNIDYLAQSSL